MRSVIFDLGGVVFRWNPNDIVREFYADDALRTLVLREIFRHPDWIELDRGTLREHDALQRFQQRTGRPLAEMTELMDAARSSLHPITGTVELLYELARMNIPLYCLSNAAVSTIEYLQERHTFWPVFRGIVISGAIKLVKPDPQIFHYIAEQYDLKPSETVFIDDTLVNVESANRLGFNTIHFRDSRQCRSELMNLIDASSS